MLIGPKPSEMEVCKGSASFMSPVRKTASEVEITKQNEKTYDFSLFPSDRIAPAKLVEVQCTAPETTSLVPDLLKHTSKDSASKDGSTQATDQPTNTPHNSSVMPAVSCEGCEHQTAEKEQKEFKIPWSEEESELRHEDTSDSLYYEDFVTTEIKDSSPEKVFSHPSSLVSGDSGLSIDITLEESLTVAPPASCDSLSLSSQTSCEGRRVTPDLLKITSSTVRLQGVDTCILGNLDPVVIQEPILKLDPSLCASVTYNQNPKTTKECEETMSIEVSKVPFTEVILHAVTSELKPAVDETLEDPLLALIIKGSYVRDERHVISQGQIHLDSKQGHLDLVKTAQGTCELTCEFAESSHQLSSAPGVSHVDDSLYAGDTCGCQTSLDVTHSWIHCETNVCATDSTDVDNSDVTSQTPNVVTLAECFDFKVVTTDVITKQTMEGVYNDSIEMVHTHDEETVDNSTLTPWSHGLALHSQDEDESDIIEPASKTCHPVSQNNPPLAASENLSPIDTAEASSLQLLTTLEEWSMAVPPICLEEEPAEISQCCHEESSTAHTEQLWAEKAECADEVVLRNVVAKEQIILCPEHQHTAHAFCDAVTDIKPTTEVSQFHEDSDQEMFFDCKQTISDYSETEADESRKLQFNPRSVKMRPKSSRTAMHCVLQKQQRKSLASSGSEDYEDAVFTHERRVERRVLEERPKRRGRAAISLNTRRVYRKAPKELLCGGAAKHMINGDCLKRVRVL